MSLYGGVEVHRRLDTLAVCWHSIGQPVLGVGGEGCSRGRNRRLHWNQEGNGTKSAGDLKRRGKQLFRGGPGDLHRVGAGGGRILQHGDGALLHGQDAL